jgi:lipopolysaccharide assembly outer membrane protein LptD (OstA)
LERFLPALPKSKTFHLRRFFQSYQVFHAFLLISVLLLSLQLRAQESDSIPASPVPDSVQAIIDQTKPKKKSGTFSDKVDYRARDSMRFNIEKKLIYLYGAAEVYYETITLKADSIVLDLDKSEVFASYTTDSTKRRIGEPYFEDKGESFTSQKMRYNFKSKKGLIYNATTEQADGTITGERIKKDTGSVIFIRDGEYCPCENADAGTYIKAKKLKIVQNDKIVTGPAYLVVEDIPTPLVLPFGFFPNKSTQSSGIVLPKYGFSPGLGFHLLSGGYYWNINDYVNTTFLGDIYTRGSWALNNNTDYKKRYKFSGNFSLSYSNFVQGFEEVGTRTKSTNFFVRWNHRQDPKARPNSTFSADVNAGSQKNFQNNFNSRSTDYLTNTFKSNINYNYRFQNAPVNLTLNASHDQNSRDSTISVRLPEIGISVSRFFPFKRKVKIGKDKWYEKIGVNYTGNAKNQVTFKESVFLLPEADSTDLPGTQIPTRGELIQQEIFDKMQNGMSHTLPISTSFKLLKYFSMNPNVSLRGVTQLKSLQKTWDADSAEVVQDTVSGITGFGDISFNSGLSTIIYGMYTFKAGPVKALRHVLTPSVNFSYKPDLSEYFYRSTGIPLAAQDTIPDQDRYTPFEYGLFGRPVSSQQGVFRFDLRNNFEMKVKNRKDTLTEFKKIKLLDQLSFGTSYDIFKDSLNWSAISASGNASLLNLINIRFNGNLDPYAFDPLTNATIDQSNFSQSGNLLRLTQGNVSVGFKLGNKKRIEKMRQENKNSAWIFAAVPWDLDVAYSFNYTRRGNAPISRKQSINLRGSMSLTNRWNVQAQTNFDFIAKKMSYTQINIYRDLDCWELRFDVIPSGGRKSYTFGLNIKPQMLKDLKLERKREWYDLNQ